MRRRLAMGRAAIVDKEKIWKDKDMSIKTKVRLVKALVFPVETYGAESWVMRKGERKSRTSFSIYRDTFELWCWRRLLGVSWREKQSKVFKDLVCLLNLRTLSVLSVKRLLAEW